MADFLDDIDDTMLANVREFMIVAGTSHEMSLHYLRAMGSRLDAALDNFFSSGGAIQPTNNNRPVPDAPRRRPSAAATAPVRPPAASNSKKAVGARGGRGSLARRVDDRGDSSTTDNDDNTTDDDVDSSSTDDDHPGPIGRHAVEYNPQRVEPEEEMRDDMIVARALAPRLPAARQGRPQVQRTLDGGVAPEPPAARKATKRPIESISLETKMERLAEASSLLSLSRLFSGGGILKELNVDAMVPGEVKVQDPVPVVTFEIRLDCCPGFVDGNTSFDPVSVLNELILHCSCCKCSSPFFQGVLSTPTIHRILDEVLEDVIKSDSQRLSIPRTSTTAIMSFLLSKYQAKNGGCACDVDLHRKLAEIIVGVGYFERYRKKAGVYRPLQVKFVKTSTHKLRVTILLASMYPRDVDGDLRLRRLIVLQHVFELMAMYKSGPEQQQKVMSYPMLPEKDLFASIETLHGCNTHQALLDLCSVHSYDPLNPLPELPTPPAMKIDLKRHQRESLAFMVDKERHGFQDAYQVDNPASRHTILYNPLTCHVRFFKADDQNTSRILPLLNPVVRGGFLCDEVGLGKTAVVLALIEANPYRAAAKEDEENGILLPATKQWRFGVLEEQLSVPTYSMKKPNGDSDDDDDEKKETGIRDNPFRSEVLRNPLTKLVLESNFYQTRNKVVPIKGTLIVVPVSICGQWVSETMKCCPNLKHILFHGAGRHKLTVADFQSADIIVTTYETLRKQVDLEQRLVALSFFSAWQHDDDNDALVQLLRDLAVPGRLAEDTVQRIKNMLENDAGTTNWIPLAHRVSDHLRTLVEWLEYKPMGVFMSRLHFHRLVLDESQKCKGFGVENMLASIHSTYRWVVTGTPISNTYASLESLLSAVGSRWYTNPIRLFHIALDRPNNRGIGWFSSVFNALREYDKLTGRARDRWYKLVEDVEISDVNGNLETRRILPWHDRLWCFVAHVLRRYMIRHAKSAAVMAEITLPPRTDVSHRVVLSADELQCYRNLATKISREVAQLRRSGSLGHRVGQLMMWVDALQRVALNPSLLSGGRVDQIELAAAAGGAREDTFTTVTAAILLSQVAAADGVPTSATDLLRKLQESPPDPGDCMVCLCPMMCPTMLACYHFFCRECINSVISTTERGEALCPQCRRPTLSQMKYTIDVASVETPSAAVVGANRTAEEVRNAIGCGSKARAVMALIETTLRVDPTNRFVVFSRFPGLLHLLRTELKNRNIQHFVIDGSTTLKQRATFITDFQSLESRLRVCMVSSRAGNAGLTLTAANHLVVMEPGLNESVEIQATARIHRFGQLRPVTIHHMFAENTIEEQIHELAKHGLLAGQGNGNARAGVGVGQGGSDALRQLETLLTTQ